MTEVGRTPWALEQKSCMGTEEAATPEKGTELRTQPKAEGYTGHRVWAGPTLKLAARCAWCRRADDLITGGLCPWALAPLPRSSAWPGGRPQHPPPTTRLLATCSQAWANSEGLGALTGPGNDAGVTMGCGQGGSIQGWTLGIPSQPGLCQPLRRASWEWP